MYLQLFHKVYELVGSRWVDRGTAFCFGHLSEDGSEALLTARSEKEVDDIILSTTIRTSDVYQRQQGPTCTRVHIHVLILR